MVVSRRDRTDGTSQGDQERASTFARHPARRAAAVRQVDARANVRRGRRTELLRSRGPRRARPTRGTDDGLGAAARHGRHRRSATAAGTVPRAAGPRRPARLAGAFPHPRQRLRRPAAAIVREPRGKGRGRRDGRFHARRSRGRVAVAALVARRIPAGLPRARRGRRPTVAPRLRADAAGTRSPAVGRSRPGVGAAPLLDDGGPLSRPDLGRRRARARLGRQSHDGRALPSI